MRVEVAKQSMMGSLIDTTTMIISWRKLVLSLSQCLAALVQWD